jgi:hypothetical protein
MPVFPINLRRVLTTIGIVALVFVVLEFNRRLEELSLLNNQNELVRTQATQAMQTQVALQTAVAYAKSTASVEEWARTDGHYIKDGDLPVVPVEAPGAAPIEMATPIPLPTPMQNWEVWWTLFFGE